MGTHRRLLSLFVLVIAFGKIDTQAAESPAVTAFRTKILYSRVAEVLSYRAQGLRACAQDTGIPKLTELSTQVADALANPASRAARNQAGVLELMGLYQKSFKFDIAEECQASFAKYDSILHSHERAKFALIEDATVAACAGTLANPFGMSPDECVKRVSRILAQIDPYCITHIEKQFDGNMRGNLCYAGDALAAHLLESVYSPALGDNPNQVMQRFLTGLSWAINDAKAGDVIDLWSLYHKALPRLTSTYEGRKTFLSLIAILSSSSLSFAGNVDATGDVFWKGALQRGLHSEIALGTYESIKRDRDSWRDYMTWAASKKLGFAIRKRDISTLNHHAFMAAFLSCAFQDQGEELAAKTIPDILGIGYEALDTKMRLLEEHMSLKDTERYFKRDVGQHFIGTRLGLDFCR